MNKLFERYKSSLNFKITLSTILIVMIGIVTIILYTQLSVAKLSNQTLDTMDQELNQLVIDFYGDHLKEVTSNLQSEYDKYFDEIDILGHTVQAYFDHYDEMTPEIDTIFTTPFFKDHLTNNGNWLQNQSDEPSTVFLGRYLLDESNQITPKVENLIKQTSIFDLFFPSFAKYGVNKIQIYFTGGENMDFTRMSPWVNIGASIYDVYPELYDLPFWQTFNPGLIESWTELKNKLGIGSEKLVRTGKPVQDGITGELNIGMTYPIWSPKDGSFLGQIAYDIPLSHFIDYTEGLQLGQNGFAMLIQSNGNVFAINDYGQSKLGFSSTSDSIQVTEKGFNTLERNLKDSAYEDVRNLDFDKINQLTEVSIEGELYYINAMKIRDFQTWDAQKGFAPDNWTLAIVLPKTEVYSMYYNSERQINSQSKIALKEQLYIAIIITFFVLAFIMLYNSKLTRKLNVLTDAVKEMRYNHYSTHLEITSEDEIGKLSSAFNEMQTEIRETIDKLNVQNERLKDEIDERIKKDRIIDYLENFDAHTDLLNKKALLNILRDIESDTDSPFTSLITIGIDELRKINDAYSFKIGDEVIRIIANRLSQLVDEKDLLFRIGGDEFGIIFKAQNMDCLILKCDDILDLFKVPVLTSYHEVSVSCSIGVSTYPNDTNDPVDLFKYANVALNHAKEGNRGGYAFYSAHMNEQVRQRMELINELSHAVERNEFYLTYQPIVDLKTQRVVAVEALIRWRSEKLGLVSPVDFISIAEETKLIINIGKWVLNEAMEALNTMTRKGFNKITIAINISVVQFYHPNFVEDIKRLIEKHQIDTRRLTFEVTEGLFLSDVHRAQDVIEQLRDLGISIAVDDFGTGYSSLSYLKNLEINHLKIDRSFIAESLDKTSIEIINAILALANSLKLSVVAEGIETNEQMKYLLDNGCNYGQGYLFSKPMKYDDFETWYMKDTNKSR
ncbi:bifunctional diguanylate cyclase/phosphodiesterase [Fusibacter bizertensis]